MPRHLYKKPEAQEHATVATILITDAMLLLKRAEAELKLSGWINAKIGIHQANRRLDSWYDKIHDELEAIRKGEL